MGLSERAEFCGRNVHVIGMARSGLAAAEVLVSLGAVVTVHDQKDSAELGEALDAARGLGAEARVGSAAYEDIGRAGLVIVSPGVPDTCPGLLAAQGKGVPILSEIELAYRVALAPIVAVTGTNGKTTTTALIGDILSRDGRQVHVAGNIVAGEIRMPLVRAAFEASAGDVIAAEISSFQLEWISSFRPRVGVLLNIAADHMDRHPDLETYTRMKARLFECQEPEDCAVLNADDARVMSIAKGLRSPVWQFSAEGEVERGTFVRGPEVWLRNGDAESLVCDTSGMKLRGRHNLENMLAAGAAALAFGAEAQAVQEAVSEFEPLPHRLEPVAEIGGVEFLNNSMCTNAAAAVRSLEAVGRPAVVIAGGKDKGDDYTHLGEAFVRYAKHVVLIGQDACMLEEAARKAGFDRITRARTMEEAVEAAWQRAEPGDTIVLSPACASFDMFKDFEHRGQVFKAAVGMLKRREGAS